MRKSPILAIIVIAQFLCTSVWFAGNAVVLDLVRAFNLRDGALGQITSAVQLGFIGGTLAFAILTISDRFSPVRVFFFSSLIAGAFNLSVIFAGGSMFMLLLLRFMTGFFLAGIYPVGMKIASDHYGGNLGKALGFLVGALVLGTAFPHLIKALEFKVSWTVVFKVTTLLALFGGSLMLFFVPDGQYRQRSAGFDASAVLRVFRNREFKSVTLGYFGHMWELYAFWAFLPVLLTSYARLHTSVSINVPLLSFTVIAGGGLACVAAGLLFGTYGAKKTATAALIISGICCFLSPLAFHLSPVLFGGYLVVWGLFVIADSPMFSTMVAQNAPSESKGTALTIVTSIGFAITIVSITLLSILAQKISIQYLFLVLGFGPLLGLYGMYGKRRKRDQVSSSK
jgi:MFS family permease